MKVAYDSHPHVACYGRGSDQFHLPNVHTRGRYGSRCEREAGGCNSSRRHPSWCHSAFFECTIPNSFLEAESSEVARETQSDDWAHRQCAEQHAQGCDPKGRCTSGGPALPELCDHHGDRRSGRIGHLRCSECESSAVDALGLPCPGVGRPRRHCVVRGPLKRGLRLPCFLGLSPMDVECVEDENAVDWAPRLVRCVNFHPSLDDLPRMRQVVAFSIEVEGLLVLELDDCGTQPVEMPLWVSDAALGVV